MPVLLRLDEDQWGRPRPRFAAPVDGGQGESERHVVALGHERLLIPRRRVEVRRHQWADRDLPERVVQVVRVTPRRLADHDEPALPQVRDGDIPVLDLSLADRHQIAAVSEREQDPGVRLADVAVAAHERLVPVVDEVVVEFPRLFPVEPRAETRQAQLRRLEGRLLVLRVAAVRLIDDRRAVVRLERLREGQAEVRRRVLPVAVPQRTDDPSVGVVVVQRPVVGPDREVRAPQLGPLHRPLRARRVSEGASCARRDDQPERCLDGRLEIPRGLDGRAVRLADLGGARRDHELEVLDRPEHTRERVGDALALRDCEDQTAETRGHVSGRPGRFGGQAWAGAGLPDLLADVLRWEVDDERRIRASDQLSPASGRLERAARRLEPQVDQVARTQQPDVDGLRFSFPVGFAHAPPSPPLSSSLAGSRRPVTAVNP